MSTKIDVVLDQPYFVTIGQWSVSKARRDSNPTLDSVEVAQSVEHINMTDRF
ncbi:MAG: hypothetical protein AAFX87_17310 [Bacteroidota bacterium]